MKCIIKMLKNEKKITKTIFFYLKLYIRGSDGTKSYLNLS